MSRTPVVIDWSVVDHYLERGCPTTEIAAIIGIHHDTLYRRCLEDNNISYSAYAQERKAKGEALLRAKQYDVAMEGDKTMLVWLGKCRLGQQEINNQETEKEKNQHVLVDFIHELIMEKASAKSKTN
jgi:hypothetical protein